MILQATWYEILAVVFGIASVWFSRKENILVFPVGLVNTLLYTWLSLEQHLIGEASVNTYYTIVSIYGWVCWARRDQSDNPALRISFSSPREWRNQFIFFGFAWILLFFALRMLKAAFAPGALPILDGFASAAAFTGMWLMARKKVESWYWWIATNLAAIPLYYVKDLKLTSIYYLILLGLAVSGLQAWRKKAIKAQTA